MFGFFDSPVVTTDQAARQIVEPIRDENSSASMTEMPEEFGRDIDVSPDLLGRGVSRGVSGWNTTVPASPGVVAEVYNDGSGEHHNEERQSRLGYYAGRDGHPGVFTSIALSPTIAEHHILGGITQYANEKDAPRESVVAPAVTTDGVGSYYTTVGSGFASAATFADGMFGD